VDEGGEMSDLDDFVLNNHYDYCASYFGAKCDCGEVARSSDLHQLRKDKEDLGRALFEAEEKVVELRKRLDIACHIKADDKVSFDWAVLDKIDTLRTACTRALATLNSLGNTSANAFAAIDFAFTKDELQSALNETK